MAAAPGPIASRRRPSPPPLGVGDELGDGGGELRQGRPEDADAGARLGEEAGIAVPASMAASTGRPAARIEYVFDGTLAVARPRRNGTTWMSPVASSSPRRSSGTKAREPDVGEAGGRASSSARIDPSPLIRNVTWGSWRAASIDEVERLGEADVAGIEDDRFVADPELGAYGVIRSPGRISSVSTKLGIVRTFSRC